MRSWNKIGSSNSQQLGLNTSPFMVFSNDFLESWVTFVFRGDSTAFCPFVTQRHVVENDTRKKVSWVFFSIPSWAISLQLVCHAFGRFELACFSFIYFTVFVVVVDYASRRLSRSILLCIFLPLNIFYTSNLSALQMAVTRSVAISTLLARRTKWAGLTVYVQKHVQRYVW